jgi:gluconokinase
MTSKMPVALVVMGVAGSGKTTVGTALAARLGYAFYDADDFHSPENVAKMRRGEPLDETDRGPWLDRLRTLLAARLSAGESLVLACSALRDSYRKRLTPPDPRKVRFIYLRITPEVARQRLVSRPEHFMPASLVGSQFDVLEEPSDAICVEASGPVADTVDRIAASLSLASEKS